VNIWRFIAVLLLRNKDQECNNALASFATCLCWQRSELHTCTKRRFFLRRFRDPIWVPRIRENYHRVPAVRENRVRTDPYRAPNIFLKKNLAKRVGASRSRLCPNGPLVHLSGPAYMPGCIRPEVKFPLDQRILCSDCCKKCRLLCLAQVVFSYFILHGGKIPLLLTTKVTLLRSCSYSQMELIV